MSNEKIDSMLFQLRHFPGFGEVVSLTVAPPITYAVVRLGGLYGVGVMKCMKEDEFDRDFGIRNAIRRALKNILEQRELNDHMIELERYNIRVTYDEHDLLRDDPFLKGLLNVWRDIRRTGIQDS